MTRSWGAGEMSVIPALRARASRSKAKLLKTRRKTVNKMRRAFMGQERFAYRFVSQLGSDSDNEWIRKSASIGGWLFQGEHEFLWELATRSKKGDVLEIGTWMGKSACILAGACLTHAPGTRVICVDPHDMTGPDDQTGYHRRLVGNHDGTFYRFIANAKRLGFRGWVVPIATLAEDAAPLIPKGLRMAFVDGAHDYEGVKKDVTMVIPKLVAGGILALHDARNWRWPDIGRYVDEELARDPRLEEIGTVETIVAFRKVGR